MVRIPRDYGFVKQVYSKLTAKQRSEATASICHTIQSLNMHATISYIWVWISTEIVVKYNGKSYSSDCNFGEVESTILYQAGYEWNWPIQAGLYWLGTKPAVE